MAAENGHRAAPCRIVIKGGGEMASGVAVRLYRAGFRDILLLEVAAPVAVRRRVSFSEAVYDGEQTVEGITAKRVERTEELAETWRAGMLAVAVDPEWKLSRSVQPEAVVDAILAKRNLGTNIGDAPLVVALGPGFVAGRDAHYVVETQRGHNLGRVHASGAAEANTGIPGNIGGFTSERVLRSPVDGVVARCSEIGDMIRAGETVCSVDGTPVRAGIDGVVRGCIREGIAVLAGTKLGDIDPRGDAEYCRTVSEKARALGGAVLETICGHVNNS